MLNIEELNIWIIIADWQIIWPKNIIWDKYPENYRTFYCKNVKIKQWILEIYVGRIFRILLRSNIFDVPLAQFLIHQECLDLNLVWGGCSDNVLGVNWCFTVLLFLRKNTVMHFLTPYHKRKFVLIWIYILVKS